MSEPTNRRRPRSFDVPGSDEPAGAQAGTRTEQTTTGPRKPRAFETDARIEMAPDDYFEREDIDVDEAVVEAVHRKRSRWSLGAIAAGAASALIGLGIALWIDGIVRTLFERNEWLGWAALALAGLFAAAILLLITREISSILRLRSVEHLRGEIEEALAGGDGPALDRATDHLLAYMSGNARSAAGRAVLDAQQGEIMDPQDRYALAERELFRGLDRDGFTLVMGSSRRVSVVTAVSPRAFIDILYVLYENFRLVRRLFELYGGRTGALGNIRLVRSVLGHLAVTGVASVGDGLVQQVIGHGVASRLSARFGEGVLNGMMTARVGLAAMEVCRPAPFHAVTRPKLSAVLATLTDRAPKDEDVPD